MEGKKSFLFHRICFFVLGFCGAIPWATILSTLDFYITSYPAYNVPLSILIPNFLGQGLFVILIYFLSFCLTLNIRIKYALLAIICLLLVLLITPLTSSEQNLYWLILVMVFILGSVNIIFQTSSTALCYVFPLEYTPLFFLGNSMAGMFAVILRMILMKLLEMSENPLIYSTIGFIITAVCIIITAMFMYQKLTTTQLYFTCLYREFKQSLAQSILGSQLNDFNSFRQVEMDENAKMDKYRNLLNSIYEDGIIGLSPDDDKIEKDDKDISIINIKDQKLDNIPDPYNLQSFEISRKPYQNQNNMGFSTNSMDMQNIQCVDTLRSSTDSVRHNKNKLDWGYFYPILKKILPYILLILLLFLQSLFVFPGMVIKTRLFDLNTSYNSLLWILLFNTADTFAKILTLWPLRLNLKTFTFLVVIRFLFWISFVFIKNSNDYEGSVLTSEWFSICHLIVFTIYGGVITNALMIAALESGRAHEKETIGLLISIPMVYGMMLGSLLALTSKYI